LFSLWHFCLGLANLWFLLWLLWHYNDRFWFRFVIGWRIPVKMASLTDILGFLLASGS
jgi:hypothetical protein